MNTHSEAKDRDSRLFHKLLIHRWRDNKVAMETVHTSQLRPDSTAIESTRQRSTFNKFQFNVGIDLQAVSRL